MADGVIRFPAVSFVVDGARVELSGTYAVRGQGLHFDGRIRLQAGVSQMLVGKKRWLLRPFDGLFRRDGATEFPIHIRGSVAHPQFGVDVQETVKRALLPGQVQESERRSSERGTQEHRNAGTLQESRTVGAMLMPDAHGRRPKAEFPAD